MWVGVTELARGDFSQAARHLDRAAELAPRDVDILYHRRRAQFWKSP
jgi:Flp pilus assembly protein TadD